MEYTYNIDNSCGKIIIQITGDLDLYSAATLLEVNTNFINNGHEVLHFDFSNVNYLDSSGVGVIIKTLQLAKTKNIHVTFSGINGSPRKVLSMANILPLLTETDR